MLEVANKFNTPLGVLLRTWYLNQNLNGLEITTKINEQGITVTPHMIWYWLKKEDIPRKTPSERKVGRSPKKYLKGIAVAENMQIEFSRLYEQGYSSADIEKMSGRFVTRSTIRNWLRGWGVHVRAVVEATNTEPYRQKKSQIAREYHINHPEARQIVSERNRVVFRRVWDERRAILIGCQERLLRKEDKQQFTVDPKEKRILTALAKCRSEQAKELLLIEKSGRFNSVAVQHMNDIYKVAFSYVRNKSAADDLVQDTYLRALHHFDTFREGTNCRAWLLKILKNTFFSSFNYGKQHPSISLSEIEENGAWLPSNENPESVIFENLSGLDDSVLSAINTLPVIFRDVVLMTDTEGFSYQETAILLKMSVSTVGSRLFRGRKLLKDKLFHYAKNHGYIK